MHRLQYIVVSVLLFLPGLLSAQLVITTYQTPQQLVNNTLVGTGVSVSNITYTGHTHAKGYFKGGNGANLGFNTGIILSNGDVNSAIGPNNAGNTGTNNNGAGDSLLNTLVPGYNLFDATILEFDFVPEMDTLRFRYVFGSEEYPEWVNSNFNDVFGFFVSGANPSGGQYNQYNIARVPGTNLPVTIDNINDVIPANQQYYVNNTNGLYIEFDGYTTVLTAWVVVIPCETYHLRLAVADAGDHIYDTGVFLEENSFGTNALGTSITYGNPNANTMIEGCSDAIVTFTLPQTQPQDEIINFSLGGTATYGVDYPNIPTSVTIPAGHTTASITIPAFVDGLTEGSEILQLKVPTTYCDSNVFDIIILDQEPLTLETSPDTVVCTSGPVTIWANALSGSGGYNYIWSTGETSNQITVHSGTYTVTVEDNCGQLAFGSVLVDTCGCTYEIGSVVVPCEGGSFCVPLNATVAVPSGVIGMDFCLNYDTNIMIPTGTATLGEVVLNNSLQQGVHANYYMNTSIPGQVHVTIFYTFNAPPGTFFLDTGNVICIDFTLIPWVGGGPYPLTSCELEESYALTEKTRCADPGELLLIVDHFLEGKVIFWDDMLKPLAFDSLNPTNYNATNIFSADSNCVNTNVSVLPDMNGNFVVDLYNGPMINIQRDIPGDWNSSNCVDSSDIMDYINGLDCYYTGLITTFNTEDVLSGNAFHPNAFQLVAADVNMNDRVRANDITLIQDRILVNICEYPQAWNYYVDPLGAFQPQTPYQPSLDWRFVDSTETAMNPAFTIDPAYPVYNAMNASQGYWRDNVPDLNQCLNPHPIQMGNCLTVPPETYHAILLGDVDGNWQAGPAPVLLKSNEEVIFHLDQVIQLQNGNIRIPISYANMSNILVAFDFSIRYNPANISIIQAGALNNAVNAGFMTDWNDLPNNNLRFTSYSLHGIQSQQAMLFIDIQTHTGTVQASDFGISKAYLNGQKVPVNFMGITTGLQKLESPTIDIYPNPSKGVFHVSLSESFMGSKVCIINALGQTIRSFNAEQANFLINLENEARGVYHLRIESAGQTISKKLVNY